MGEHENSNCDKDELYHITTELLDTITDTEYPTKIEIYTFKQIEYIAAYLKKNGPAMSNDAISAVVSNIYTSSIGSLYPNTIEYILSKAGIDVVEKYSYISLLDCAEVEEYVRSVIKRYQLGYFTDSDSPSKIADLNIAGYYICPYIGDYGLSYIIADFVRMMLIMYEDDGCITKFDMTFDQASASYIAHVNDEFISYTDERFSLFTNEKINCNLIERYENNLKLNKFLDDHDICCLVPKKDKDKVLNS